MEGISDSDKCDAPQIFSFSKWMHAFDAMEQANSLSAAIWFMHKKLVKRETHKTFNMKGDERDIFHFWGRQRGETAKCEKMKLKLNLFFAQTCWTLTCVSWMTFSLAFLIILTVSLARLVRVSSSVIFIISSRSKIFKVKVLRFRAQASKVVDMSFCLPQTRSRASIRNSEQSSLLGFTNESISHSHCIQIVFEAHLSSSSRWGSKKIETLQSRQQQRTTAEKKMNFLW